MSFRPHEERPHRTADNSFVTTRVLAVDPDATHPLCSVYPVPLYIDVQYCHTILPALETEGDGYTKVDIRPIPDEYDSGEGRRRIVYSRPAKQTAEELIGITPMTPDGDPDLVNRGIFVPAGETPTEEEIMAAVAKRNEWWLNHVIPKADSAFAKRRDPGMVDDNAKVAVKWLGLKRDWATSEEPNSRCPVCQLPIASGALKCINCNEFLVWAEGVPRWKKQQSIASDARTFMSGKTVAEKKAEATQE